jgi:hypothetical protein
MPSIPQSLLWISLVVLWLFVLVPMLINKRDTVRRTSDIALATRVLNSGRSRLARRGGPATGHRHDPHWQRDEADLDDDFDAYEAEDYEREVREAVREASVRSHTRSVMVVAAVTEEVTAPADPAEPDYLDVDVVDDNSGALPVGAGIQDSLFSEAGEVGQSGTFGDADRPEPAETIIETTAGMVTEATAEVMDDAVAEAAGPESDAGVADTGVLGETADEYEYVDDTSGLEAEEEPLVTPSSRRRRLDSSTAAAVSARKYRFRKRVLTAMAAVMVITAALSFAVSPTLWWACGATAGVTMLYLAYLRRQTRIEEQVRRRRQQRVARSRIGEGLDGAGAYNRDSDVVSSRLRRPGAVVLDIDDEDPTFEHLDEVAYSRRYDLPRASGQ